MEKRAKEKTDKWQWRPVVLAAIFAACTGIFGWGISRMIAASDRNAQNEVWKAQVTAELAASKRQDTLCSKRSTEIELLVRTFIEEVRTERPRQMLIDDLQNRQLTMLAEKTKSEKDMEKLIKEQQELRDMLEKQTLIRKTKYNDSLPTDIINTTDSCIVGKKDNKVSKNPIFFLFLPLTLN